MDGKPIHHASHRSSATASLAGPCPRAQAARGFWLSPAQDRQEEGPGHAAT
jgi:hypothetical protein